MFLVNLDDAFEGYVGSIFLGLGFIIFCILALTTNYVYVGVAIGLAFGGLVSLISALFYIYTMITTGTKSRMIIGIVCAVIIVISIIYSIVSPLYIQGLKISFSRFTSVFVEPFIIYAFMSVILSYLYGHGDGSIFIKILAIIGGAGFGLLIAGIAYFAGLSPVLSVLNKNFSYEDRQLIRYRTMTYGSNEFNEVFPKILEEQKEMDDRDNLDQDRREKNIAKAKFRFKNEYIVFNFVKEDEEHVYTLMIKDQAKYDKTGDFPKYNVKVNLETYEVISIEKIEYKSFNELLNNINDVPIIEENE